MTDHRSYNSLHIFFDCDISSNQIYLKHKTEILSIAQINSQ
jgi:hypothetical protein